MSSSSRLATLAVASVALLGGSALTAGAAAAATGASTTSKADTHALALLKSAIANTKGAKSFTVQGGGTSSGETVKVDITAGASDAYGVLTYGKNSTTLRRVGSAIYAEGTKGFLEQQGASASQAAVEANKWFRIPTSETSNYSSLKEFLTVSGLLGGLVPAAAKGPLTSIKSSTLEGQAVEIVSGTFSGQKGALYVTTHGKPYLLRIIQANNSSGGGTLTLSHFNASVHTTAPKGAVTQ
jgi:hypothetical protein